MKQFRVGLCKRYWRYVTVEADNEREARSKAAPIAEKDNEHLTSSVMDYTDYNNNIEIDDIVEN